MTDNLINTRTAYHRRRAREYALGATTTPPAATTAPTAPYERETPVPATLEKDVLAPLLQSLITTLWYAFLARGAIWAAEFYFTIPLTPWEKAYMATLTAAFFGVFSWSKLLGLSLEALWAIEKVTGLEVTGDKVKGKPTEIKLSIDLRHPGNHSQTRVEIFKTNEEAFLRFVRAMLRGKSPAINDWAGRGKPFAQKPFTEMMDYLIETGFFIPEGEWETAGRALTEAGRTAFIKCLQQRSPTPLIQKAI